MYIKKKNTPRFPIKIDEETLRRLKFSIFKLQVLIISSVCYTNRARLQRQYASPSDFYNWTGECVVVVVHSSNQRQNVFSFIIIIFNVRSASRAGRQSRWWCVVRAQNAAVVGGTAIGR